MAVVIPVTGPDGVVEKEPCGDPLPSWPKLLSPQQRIVPSRRTAQLCSAPGAITAGTMPLTVTGVEELAVLPFPSRPSSPRPQHCSVPSRRSAHMWKTPASMATAVVMPLTVTGVGVGVTGLVGEGETRTAPLPSSPQVLSPQQRTVPSCRRAQVYQPPAEIATAVVMPLTVTGVGLKVDGRLGTGSLVPLPSWPRSFCPQQRTVPSPGSAQVWNPPAVTATAVSPVTRTGVEDRLGTGLPSWPVSFRPQHCTVPS